MAICGSYLLWELDRSCGCNLEFDHSLCGFVVGNRLWRFIVFGDMALCLRNFKFVERVLVAWLGRMELCA